MVFVRMNVLAVTGLVCCVLTTSIVNGQQMSSLRQLGQKEKDDKIKKVKTEKTKKDKVKTKEIKEEKVKDIDACTGLQDGPKGLCNSFCNAKHCHLPENAEKHSCQRLKRNFFDLTGLDLFPCEEPVEVNCPCWEEIPLFEFVDIIGAEITQDRSTYRLTGKYGNSNFASIELGAILADQTCFIKGDPVSEEVQLPVNQREFDKCAEQIGKALTEQRAMCNTIRSLEPPSTWPPCPCWTDEDIASIDLSLVSDERITSSANYYESVIFSDHFMDGENFSLGVSSIDTKTQDEGDYCYISIDGKSEVRMDETTSYESGNYNFDVRRCFYDLEVLSANAQFTSCYDFPEPS